MELACRLFAIIGLFVLPATLHIFPNFYLKIRTNKKYDIAFRFLLFFLVLITELWFYIHYTYLDNNHTAWKDWKRYIWLELCNFSAFIIMILLMFPNKLMMDCTLPMGLIGPCTTVFFPMNLNSESFTDYGYWQDMFGHITLFFSYLFLFTYGYTKSTFNATLVKRSLIYIVIVGLSIEIYNLAFSGKFVYKEIAAIFIGNKSEIYSFLFVISWIFPLSYAIFYFLIWYFKPIFSYEKNEKINDTWFEKLIKPVKLKVNRNAKL